MNNYIRNSFIFSQQYDRYMLLRIKINSNDDELRNVYTLAVDNHNQKVTNNINTTLKSPNGSFKLVLQDDAHLILYDGANRLAWRTGVFNPPNSVGPFRLELQQEDGHLVIYDSRGRQRPVWQTNRTSPAANGPFRLAVQDDSNVVVYDKNNNALWARI